MTAPAIPQRAWVEQIMGLPVSVHVRGDGLAGERVEKRVAEVFAELRHVDAVLSPYRDDSDLTRWEHGQLAVGEADPILAQVMTLCAEASRRTGGWFDAHGLPDPRTAEPRYDPSGLVKGWAAERAARHLADLSGYGWCLNAGGDVLVHAPDDQPPWRVGIENPNDPARIMSVVERRTGAIATSGSTHRGAHIIDPHTGRPAGGTRAVTVTGPRLLWADVYATAAAVRGATALAWIDDLAGYEALIVTSSGMLRTTGGWPTSSAKVQEERPCASW
ncbi:FAD:protein FMN transferase [Actinoplanes sp. NPDC051343]|uniref:FAD:protein FMN transferase n=1 Tax=Actinoplanes sp. NPDC051343 TaxID=3363906 RepID=UPI00378A7E2E